MSPSEIIDLLTMAAAYDQRTVGQGDVAAWHAILFKIDLDEAHEALIAHYRESNVRIMPADIYKRCRPQATRHLSLVESPASLRSVPRDPDRWKRMWQAALTASAAECAARQGAVLGHTRPEGDGSPPLAMRLCDKPLDYARPDQWTGFVPPEMFNGERNNSPRRKALLAILEEATAAGDVTGVPGDAG